MEKKHSFLKQHCKQTMPAQMDSILVLAVSTHFIQLLIFSISFKNFLLEFKISIYSILYVFKRNFSTFSMYLCRLYEVSVHFIVFLSILIVIFLHQIPSVPALEYPTSLSKHLLIPSVYVRMLLGPLLFYLPLLFTLYN